MAACRAPLFFQEQIQAPENGSIARFDGLGCYQSDSETGDDFCASAHGKAPFVS